MRRPLPVAANKFSVLGDSLLEDVDCCHDNGSMTKLLSGYLVYLAMLYRYLVYLAMDVGIIGKE